MAKCAAVIGWDVWSGQGFLNVVDVVLSPYMHSQDRGGLCFQCMMVCIQTWQKLCLGVSSKGCRNCHAGYEPVLGHILDKGCGVRTSS